ncbi:hypothetical protein BH11BAC3_BH11BAC3_37650 [soil metagenome]
MATDQNQNDNSRQFKCDCLKKEIEESKNSLNELRKHMISLINNNDFDQLAKISPGTSFFENDIAGKEAEIRKLGCVETESPQRLDNNQTIISTSSVRRKDRFALETTSAAINKK